MNPYNPPSVDPFISTPISKKGHRLALIGALFQILPIIGLIWSVIKMKTAMTGLRPTGQDVGALAAHIGEILVATSIALAGFLLGLVFLAVALLKYRYRASWSFWFLVIYGALLLFAFPIGTVIGLLLLNCAFTKKTEFLTPKSSGEPVSPPPAH